MTRDIDYAAIAVTNALIEKYGRQNDLQELTVMPNERTISLLHGGRRAEGTRDELLSGIRKSPTYEQLWQLFAVGSSNRVERL